MAVRNKNFLETKSHSKSFTENLLRPPSHYEILLEEDEKNHNSHISEKSISPGERKNEIIEKISFSDFKNLKQSFWILLIISMTSEGKINSSWCSYYRT